MKTKMEGVFAIEEFPILHPHRILTFLFDQVGLEIPIEQVQEYWRDAQACGRPWAEGETSCRIPVALYGDSAKTWVQYKFEKITGIFMSLPLWRPRSVRCSKFLLFSCPTEKLVSNRTYNTVFRRIVWSLNYAFDGINPTAAPRGKTLTPEEVQRAGTPVTRQGHKFVVTEVKGDWEYIRDTFRVSASWNGNTICYKCPAMAKGPPGLVYFNFGSSPSSGCMWLKEEFSLQGFISLRLKSKNLCALANHYLQLVMFS